MHLTGAMFHSRKYPTKDHYPFHLPLFRATKRLVFDTPVTLFVGENGTGKSTFVKMLLGEEKPDKGSFDIGETDRKSVV